MAGPQDASHAPHLGELTGHRAADPATSRRKRVFDVVFASALLVLCSPLLLAIALAIRITSPGPVIFRQRRMGFLGRPFTMLKFRTMDAGASEELHEQFVAAMILTSVAVLPAEGVYKLQADPRVTRVGRLLRKLSLDELPQLVNVLKGEMSVVGPRPPLTYEVAKYAPWQRARLGARPGLTGLWQVSGRNRLTHVEMCRLDVEYLNDWTFSRDMGIILRTPWAAFIDRGGAE